jgi:2-oxoglutarate dehydrogenase E1 component
MCLRPYVCDSYVSYVLCLTGRLNVLANVVRKPMRQIFSEFTGVVPVGDHYFGTGDVKYHLGTSYDRPTISGKRIHLSLLANPSHLEVCLSPVPDSTGQGYSNMAGSCD